MSEVTKIQWCDHSWSPWWGCTPVSPGCANCYAAKWAKFTRGLEYKRGVPRQKAKDWNTPDKWSRMSPLAPKRLFPSMCDPFDAEVPLEWKAELWRLIWRTNGLIWLLLTKRPENFEDDWKALQRSDLIAGSSGLPKNVWLGVSVENQEQADKRIPILLSIPAKVRFLSVEPMLGRIDLEPFLYDLRSRAERDFDPSLRRVNWVIFGGESGPGARPCDVNWIWDGVTKCKQAGVPVFVKQLGSFPVTAEATPDGWPPGTVFQSGCVDKRLVHLAHKKGGDPVEWPTDLRVREFPVLLDLNDRVKP